MLSPGSDARRPSGGSPICRPSRWRERPGRAPRLLPTQMAGAVAVTRRTPLARQWPRCYYPRFHACEQKGETDRGALYAKNPSSAQPPNSGPSVIPGSHDLSVGPCLQGRQRRKGGSGSKEGSRLAKLP